MNLARASTREEAVKQWETRAPDTAQPASDGKAKYEPSGEEWSDLVRKLNTHFSANHSISLVITWSVAKEAIRGFIARAEAAERARCEGEMAKLRAEVEAFETGYDAEWTL